jgi:hypothetical protein
MSTKQSAKSLAGVALLAIVAAWPGVADAQDVPTIKVGQATKKTVGTITATNSGDVACYLTLKDDRGVEFKEMAEFEICDQKPPLRGKRVALTYRLQNVMADECQGNPDCKKTRSIALVSAAKIIAAPAPPPAAASPSTPPAPSGAKQASFCTPAETVVFSCRTGGRMVSVCASKDAAANRGTLQYRYGKIDLSEPLDLSFPEEKIVPSKAAVGAHQSFAAGGSAWLRFIRGQSTYTVYTGIGNWGPKGEPLSKQGLYVERGGKEVATLKCLDKPISLLGPDLFEKLGIKANGQDFDLPD